MAANSTTTVYGKKPVRLTLDKAKSKVVRRIGLGFPLGKNRQTGGFLRRVSNIEAIQDQVVQLLNTEKGERVMLPRFGVSLKKFLFSPLDEDTFEAIKLEILEAVDRYILGVNVIGLQVLNLGVNGPSGGNALKVILTLQLVEEQLAVLDVEVIIK